MENRFHSDSIFIRDYYTTDCYVGDFYSFNHSLNLKDYANELKQRLGVQFIFFADERTSTWEDDTPRKYKLVYQTNARSKDWSYLFGFYDCLLQETLTMEERKYVVQRDAHYRWCLFFWIQTAEYMNAWENKKR